MKDKDIRYYIDLDLGSGQILCWDSGNRFELVRQAPDEPTQLRLYLSKGQYNKLLKKEVELRKENEVEK